MLCLTPSMCPTGSMQTLGPTRSRSQWLVESRLSPKNHIPNSEQPASPGQYMRRLATSAIRTPRRTGGNRESIRRFSGLVSTTTITTSNANWAGLRTNLVVPFLDRKRMSDSKPIPVHFKVRGLAVNIARQLALARGSRRSARTHYAGNSSTLKAAATMAHCANDG